MNVRLSDEYKRSDEYFNLMESLKYDGLIEPIVVSYNKRVLQNKDVGHLRRSVMERLQKEYEEKRSYWWGVKFHPMLHRHLRWIHRPC